MTKHLKIITIIVFLAILICYTLLYFFPIKKSPQPTPTSQSTPIIFSTGIYGAETEWLSETELIVMSEKSIIIYNIEERTFEMIYNINEKEIADLHIDGDTISFITQSEDQTFHHEIDQNGKPINKISIPKADQILLGNNRICLTTINTIRQNDEIATEIEIIATDSKHTKISDISSNLTLIPLNCDDFVYLQPPYPILQDAIYYWNSSNEEISYFYKTSENKSLEETIIENGYIGVRSGTTITISKAGAQKNDNKKGPLEIDEHIDAWGISPFGHLITINSDSIRIYNKDEITETIDIDVPNEIFVDITTSPGNTYFVLTSSSGELWLLQRH